MVVAGAAVLIAWAAFGAFGPWAVLLLALAFTVVVFAVLLALGLLRRGAGAA